MGRKLEPVSFNLNDEYERELHDYAKRQVFSKYVKRLIDWERKGLIGGNAPMIEEVSETQQRGNPMSFI